MVKIARILGFVALLCWTCAWGQWQAGVARVDVTPDEPIWMAGYAARTKPSEGVLQSLHVKALALKDASGAVSVLVAADTLGFTREMSRKVVSEAQARHGIPRERLVLNASHTHSGPVTGQLLRPAYVLPPEQAAVVTRYTEKFLGHVVAVIGESVKSLGPAELAFEQGLAGFAVNRRRVGHREYAGPVDHDVPVLSVRRPDGRLLAVVFGYACHATVLSDYVINGDWPGFAQEALEGRHAGVTALFVTGCGADQNPLPRRKVELARKYGEILAESVDLVLGGKMKPVNGPLKAAFATVDLPFQAPPSRQGFEKRLEKESAMERNHARLMLERLDRDGKLAASYPYPVQLWRFGDSLTFISMAGEVVVDYSLRFKQQYGWDDTWVSGYNNDVFAYIPSLRVLREGGYEGATAMIPYGQPAPFAEPVEEIIVKKVAELARQVGLAK